jgi:hypothetical protein
VRAVSAVRATWSEHDGVVSLRLTGLDADALRAIGAGDRDVARRFPVYPTHVVEADSPTAAPATLQALPGRYVVDGESAEFVPRYPFLAGTSYTVLVHTSIAAEHERGRSGAPAFDREDFAAVTIARPSVGGSAGTRVVALHPTARLVPRNLLKLYVRFSAPMGEGHAAGHVRLRAAASGEAIDDVFLPVADELWDPERRRITIFFDPARIKRGLAPHEEAGYPLRTGAAVEVVVDEGFLDASGRPLAAPDVRRYDVGDDARAHVEPGRWGLEPPRRETTVPLVIRFDRPLDAALLEHCVTVRRAGGARVEGAVTLGAEERSWAFTPAAPWSGASHELVVDSILEDLAGNSVARVFDRDLAQPDQSPRPPDPVTRPFTPS